MIRKKIKYTDVSKYECAAAESGYKIIAGLDEAGRGALCGPVVASAVVLYPGQFIPGVDDSKRLSPIQRQKMFEMVMDQARAVGIGLARATEVDRINVLEATRLAMMRALQKLQEKPDYLLLDAIKLAQISIPQESIIKGDSLSHSIAAASIIAKVIRDRIMLIWNRKYPGYGWETNKGYGTAFHLEALRVAGFCSIHRKTFKGVYDCRGLFG